MTARLSSAAASSSALTERCCSTSGQTVDGRVSGASKEWGWRAERTISQAWVRSRAREDRLHHRRLLDGGPVLEQEVDLHLPNAKCQRRQRRCCGEA
jgi:hypothetical protein